MEQQIKWKELPEGYFVTDKYHKSGNKEFISYKDIYKCECDNTQWKTNKQGKKGCVQCTKGNSLNQIKLGTKHIQLFAVNIPIYKRKEYAFMEDDYDFDAPLSFEDYNIAKNAKEQGKDFFIYKVSEVKDVN